MGLVMVTSPVVATSPIGVSGTTSGDLTETNGELNYTGGPYESNYNTKVLSTGNHTSGDGHLSSNSPEPQSMLNPSSIRWWIDANATGEGEFSTVPSGNVSLDEGEIQSHPVVDDGFAAISTDNGTFAFNPDNGTVLWHSDKGTKFTSSPALTENYVIATASGRNVSAYYRANGTEVWNRSLSGTYGSIGSQEKLMNPIVHNGVVYMTSGAAQGSQEVVALNVDDGTNFQSASDWDFNGANHFATPLAYHESSNTMMFAAETYRAGTPDNFTVIGFNPDDGTKKFDLEVDPNNFDNERTTPTGQEFTHIGVVDDKAYIPVTQTGSSKGHIAVVDIPGQSYHSTTEINVSGKTFGVGETSGAFEYDGNVILPGGLTIEWNTTTQSVENSIGIDPTVPQAVPVIDPVNDYMIFPTRIQGKDNPIRYLDLEEFSESEESEFHFDAGFTAKASMVGYKGGILIFDTKSRMALIGSASNSQEANWTSGPIDSGKQITINASEIENGSASIIVENGNTEISKTSLTPGENKVDLPTYMDDGATVTLDFSPYTTESNASFTVSNITMSEHGQGLLYDRNINVKSRVDGSSDSDMEVYHNGPILDNNGNIWTVGFSDRASKFDMDDRSYQKFDFKGPNSNDGYASVTMDRDTNNLWIVLGTNAGGYNITQWDTENEEVVTRTTMNSSITTFGGVGMMYDDSYWIANGNGGSNSTIHRVYRNGTAVEIANYSSANSDVSIQLLRGTESAIVDGGENITRVNLSTGNVEWQLDAGTATGYYFPVTVADGDVFVSTDYNRSSSYHARIDGENGSFIWHNNNTTANNYWSPAIGPEGNVYSTGSGQMLQVYDGDNGTLIYEFNGSDYAEKVDYDISSVTGGSGNNTAVTPVVDSGGVVYLESQGNHLIALDWKNDTIVRDVRFTQNGTGWYEHSSPIVDEDSVYVFGPTTDTLTEMSVTQIALVNPPQERYNMSEGSGTVIRSDLRPDPQSQDSSSTPTPTEIGGGSGGAGTTGTTFTTLPIIGSVSLTQFGLLVAVLLGVAGGAVLYYRRSEEMYIE